MSKKTQPPLKPCPECGGRRVRTAFNVIPTLGMEENALGMEKNELQIRQPQHVIGLGGFFKGQSNKSEVASASCIECGYTTLYATDPKNLIPDEE